MVERALFYKVAQPVKKGGRLVAIRSDAQRRAVAKYNAANYDRIELRVKKGKKGEIKAFAESRGQALNEFINDAIDSAMTERQ